MSKKLLNKTTGNFLVYSVVILLISAPAFYFIAERLYLDETDETLMLHKEEFLQRYLPTFTESDIIQWNKYNRNVSIDAGRDLVGDTLFNKVYYDTLENEYEPYRELNMPISINGKKYTYIERSNLVEKADMVEDIAVLFTLIIFILLTGILLITKISSVRLWKPFYDTLEKIRQFEIDKSAKPQFMDTNIVEFEQLNKNLKRLIKRNTEIYNNQHEFVENAAHELQTPLALFQTKLDTLMQLDDITKEQSVILNSLNNDIANLNRLNKNLLLMSKIENEQFQDQEPMLLNDYLEKNFTFFTEQASAKSLEITTDFTQKIIIKTNPTLLEVLVNNLFLNAIRHNRYGGKIIIIAANRSLTFSNSGLGDRLVVDKLFNRFSKSNPSSVGNGLGLAIVKKIVEMNGWTISYAFIDDMHRFTINFDNNDGTVEG